ncbi:hypothetical protein IKG48_03120 [Candidatus Saccharibacteria bacterium]|nr:hypothetical protein [Candidatus Saccharibacteria bacterium]
MAEENVRVRVVPNIELVAKRDKTNDYQRWMDTVITAPLLIIACPIAALILFSVSIDIAFIFKAIAWLALVFLTFISVLWAREKERKMDDWILKVYEEKVKKPLEEDPENVNTKYMEFTADYSTMYPSTFEGSMTPVSVLWVIYLIVGSLYTLRWYVAVFMVVIEIAMIVVNVLIYSKKFMKTIPANPEA